MSESDPTPNKELLAKALRALEKARAQVDALKAERSEPIAIVGIGCRLPGGVSSPRALWEALRAGRDLTSEIPRERWNPDLFHDDDPATPGRMVMRRGGFVDDIAGFDPEVFGIAPREAPHIDPQQRLLLEVAWEALEHGAIAPTSLKGTATGVWVGISTAEYQSHLLENLPRDQIVGAQGTGIAHSAAAGRISYALGLQGPSLAINTACSSSLVALHLACASLRAGESTAAIVGGVNVLIHPISSMVFSQARMLSPDGRCKAFSAAANGYGRAEGAAAVVLKRRSDALRDGDRILAEIVGSAVNQDGASGGLTVPNGPMQVAVIRRALEQAGLDAGDVDLIEAHGTGTPLGDPLELGALADVFSGDRGQPLALSSIKANCGHLEAAAGIGGFLRLVLQLQHGEFLPHVMHGEPTPYVRWDEMPFALPLHPTQWPERHGRRVGGVSSFGFTGTNAHVVCRGAPDPERLGRAPGAAAVLLSARTEEALADLVDGWGSELGDTDATVAAVAATASRGRAAMRYRTAVVADSMDELRRKLRSLDASAFGEVPARALGRASFVLGTPPRQWREIARLLAHEPGFASAFASWCLGLPDPEDPWALEGTPSEPALSHGVLYAFVSWLSSSGFRFISAAGAGEAAAVAACLVGDLEPEEGARGLLDPASTLPVEVRPDPGRLVDVVVDLGGGAPSTEAPVLRFDREAPADVGIACLLADGWLAGCTVKPPQGRQHFVDLPTYPFQRRPFMVHPNPSTRFPEGELGHPLLGVPRSSEFEDFVFNVTLRPDAPPWLSDDHHAVTNGVLLELLRAAGAHVLGTENVEMLDVFIEPFVLGSARCVRGHADRYEDDRFSLQFHVLTDEDVWDLKASAGVRVPGTAPKERVGESREAVALGPEWDFDSQSYGLHPLLGATLWPRDEEPRATRIERVVMTGRCGASLETRSHGADRFLIGERGIFGVVEGFVITDEPPNPRGHRLTYSLSVIDSDESRGEPPAAIEVVEVSNDLAISDLPSLLLRLRDTAAALPRDGYAAIVTRVAFDPTGSPGEAAPPSVAGRAVWGAVRALRLEYPNADLRLVDIEPTAPLPRGVHDQESFLNGPGASPVAVLPRLRRQPTGRNGTLSVRGTWVVTGGAGGIGRALTSELVSRGASRVLTASRSAQEIGASDDRIEHVVCDVTDAAAVKALIGVAQRDGDLRGVIHGAGVLDDALAPHLDASRVARVLAPKLEGGRLLIDALNDADLDSLAFLGSSSAWFGNVGQVHYAAANGGLEALAGVARMEGLPGVSIAFGPWRETGMTAGAASSPWESAGVRSLYPRDALDALFSVMGDGPGEALAVDIDWAELDLPRPMSLLALLQPLRDTSAELKESTAARALREADEAGRRSLLSDALRSALAATLRVDEGSIDPSIPLLDVGVDSLLAMEFRHRFQRATSVVIPLAQLVEGASLDDVIELAVQGMGETGLEMAGGDDVDALLDEIEGLSDDEVRRMLGEDDG